LSQQREVSNTHGFCFERVLKWSRSMSYLSCSFYGYIQNQKMLKIGFLWLHSPKYEVGSYMSSPFILCQKYQVKCSYKQQCVISEKFPRKHDKWRL
jgi:hypothetical protein